MKETAVQWFMNELANGNMPADEAYKQALEMEKKQSHQYAEFAIRCDRKDMKILNFEDWIKL